MPVQSTRDLYLRGEIPGIRIGRRLYIDDLDWQAYLSRQKEVMSRGER